VNLVHDADEAPPGDILFLLSYWSIVPESTLRKHTHNLVVHASDLPKGKGWSPVTWQILEGCNEIPFCLFEAVDSVDAGPVFLRDVMVLQGHELLDDIRRRQAAKSIEMCTRFTADYPFICPLAKPQAGKETFYPRRSPDDSELDPNKSLAEQFNLLRTVDNEAYPAFFEHHGVTYFLTIERKGDQPESQEEDHDH
jgi:methionyl-tRNA formyltransferase